MNPVKIFPFLLALATLAGWLYLTMKEMPAESFNEGSNIMGMFHP